MPQDILITPASGEPQILFRGSGVNDTPITLNVLSSYQSASRSGTALVFEGTQGQLFSITDNLSSGTIFSVGDITGLPLLKIDASGDVTIAEYGRFVGIASGVPRFTLDVRGTGNFSSGIIAGGNSTFTSGVFQTLSAASGTITSGNFNTAVIASGTFANTTTTSGTIGTATITSETVTTSNIQTLNVGSGTFQRINVSGIAPSVVFVPSGTRTNPITLNVLTSASGNVSGIATLSFDGSAGQLFSVSNVLDSGTIFSVNDVGGLPLIEADASGTVHLSRFGTNIRAYNTLELMPSGFASGDTSPLRFYEMSPGTNFVAFKAAPQIASDVVWTLPSGDGASSAVLTTNGAGQLSWSKQVSSEAYIIESGGITTRTTGFELAATNNGRVTVMNNTSGVTISIPTGLPVGFSSLFVQINSGDVTFLPNASVTLSNSNAHTKIKASGSTANLLAIASNYFILSGDTKA